VKDALIVSLLSLLPRRATSRAMGGFARLSLPGVMQRTLLRWYVRKYGPSLDECEGTLEDYPSLASFFVRALRPGVRPVDGGADAIVSPVDGKVHSVGMIEGGRLPQAPGLDSAVATLLGAEGRWDGGAYSVIYLSPKDYHRVHAPREGRLLGWRYRRGEFWPVFPAATRKIRDLFARNERLVIRLGTDLGEIAVVMVGAFGVGRMSTTFADIVTNTGGPDSDGIVPDRVFARAEELGRFEMGSTVVLVTEPGRVRLDLEPGATVRLGERIGGAR
jgi:phosphatidylserine decarboxylase